MLTTSGCLLGPCPEPQTDIPLELLEAVTQVDKAQQVPVLIALTTLVQAGFFSPWSWTPPTEGTDPVKYNVEMMFDVADTSFYMLNASKRNVVVRVNGEDIAAVVGPFSVYSDTAFVEDFNE